LSSVLAIVSKAIFEKTAKDLLVGDVLDVDRYVSKNVAFEKLGAGDAIFLVTVRPKETLWLVAIIEEPKRAKGQWLGEKNATPIANVSTVISSLRFASGEGIKAKKGALGMSLQTPRVLTDPDVALLRKFAPSSAVAAYRGAVEETPAARRARKEAAAAGAQQLVPTLRFESYRKPFEMLKKLRKPQQKQLALLTKNNRAGKPSDCVDDENWAPMELVDVADVASSEVRYQLYLWPWGSGHLFAHDSQTTVATIIQHSFDKGMEDLELRRALAAAYAAAKPKLKELVDFQLDRTASAAAPKEQPWELAKKRLAKELGKSKERYRLFRDLKKEQKAAVVEIFKAIREDVWHEDLGAFGLPPLPAIHRWAEMEAPSLLERGAGKWPVWKWLKAATRGEVDERKAIGAIEKSLGEGDTSALVRLIVTRADDYDLFDRNAKHERGERYADENAEKVIRFLAALVDASGDDAAIAFAERAQAHLAKKAEFWLAAIATFALTVRAKREHEPFPERFEKLAAEANFLGQGCLLRRSMREVVELIPPKRREAFLDAYAPNFAESYFEEIKNGREYEVPCLLHRWWFVDLIASEDTAETAIETIFDWDDDPKPKQETIDALVSIGPVAIPALKKAAKKKSRWKSIFTAALARLER